jgi:hypothetical protein
MALLAYMIVVAMLITSAFIGYEWVATSSGPRMYAEGHSTAKPTTRRLAAVSDKPTGTTVASANDHVVVVRDHRTAAQRRHAHTIAREQAIAREMAARNAITQGLVHDATASHDGKIATDGKVATSETALGYADAPSAPPPTNNGRLF